MLRNLERYLVHQSPVLKAAAELESDPVASKVISDERERIQQAQKEQVEEILALIEYFENYFRSWDVKCKGLYCNTANNDTLVLEQSLSNRRKEKCLHLKVSSIITGKQSVPEVDIKIFYTLENDWCCLEGVELRDASGKIVLKDRLNQFNAKDPFHIDTLNSLIKAIRSFGDYQLVYAQFGHEELMRTPGRFIKEHEWKARITRKSQLQGNNSWDRLVS